VKIIPQKSARKGPRKGDRRKTPPQRLRRAIHAAGLFVPGGLAVGGAVALGVAGEKGAPLWAAVAAASTLFLAARLRRPQTLLALLLLALAWGAPVLWAPGGWDLPGPGRVLFAFLGLLLPLNLLLCGFTPEAASWSRRGRLLWGPLLGAEALAVAFFARYPELGAGRLLAGPVTWTLPLPGSDLPWPVAATVALSAVGLGLLALRRRGPVEASLAWVALGVGFAFGAGRPGPTFTLHFAGAAVALALGAVESSRVLAFTDILTGVPGRRALEEALGRLSPPFTVAMVDIDHFKRFNDRFGHSVGDQALRYVADFLGRTRGGARVFRYGGEEFTLLFPGLTAEQAQPHLETTREALAASRFVVRKADRPPAMAAKGDAGSAVPLTVSIGLAAGAAGEDPRAVLKRADAALYRAKKAGRNRLAR